MKIQIPLSLERLSEVFLCSNIMYWGTHEHDGDDGCRYVVENSTNLRVPVTEGVMKRGLEVMALRHPRLFMNMLDDAYNADSNTADVLVQCAIFGECRYG